MNSLNDGVESLRRVVITILTQNTNTCSKSTIETVEKGVKVNDKDTRTSDIFCTTV